MSLPSSNLSKRLRGLNQAAFLTAFLFIAAPFSSALAVCLNPAGNAGDIIYNGDENLLSYCDDTNWIGVRGSGNDATAPASGLIAHWKMEETSGSTIVDQIGNNDGTWSDNTDSVITTESVTGTDNNALDFEIGDDAYIVVNAGAGSTDLDNIGPMSVCAWVNFESLPGAGGPIVGKTGGASFGNAGWLLGYNDAGGQRFFFESNLGDGFQTDFNTTNLGTFQHLCATWDGTDGTAGINIYLDSILDNNSAFTDSRTADDAAYDIEICADDSSSTQCDGIIDDVRIYNRVITATEVSDIYQATGGTNLSLKLHYKLDETSGITVTDSSLFGNDGTWAGSPGISGAVGRINGSVNFFDNDWVINAGSDDSLDDIFLDGGTIAAWIRPTQTPFYDYGRVVSKMTDRPNNGGYSIYTSIEATAPQSVWFAQGFGGTTKSRWSTPAGSLNMQVWNHIAVVYDQETPTDAPTVYINGIEQNLSQQETGTGSADSDAAENFLVGVATIGNDNFEGQIDDVRVYRRMLSEDEIQSLAAACQEGSMIYNGDHHVPQYCAGDDNWVAMGPVRGGIENGLVGHWQLNETSGTTAGDASGNLLNGSMQGGLDASSDSADGKVSTSLVFDGVDDGIQISNSPSIENFTAFSLSAWVYPTASAQGSGSRVISKPDGGSGDNYNLGFGNTGTSWFRIETDGDNQTEILGNALPLNEWTHIAGTWDGKNMRLYENGIEVSTSPVAKTGVIDADGTPLSIGTHTNSPAGRRFPGRIDDARIYNRTLSDAEITALYELGNNEDSSLVGHWKLDDLSGTTATDSSINVNNGTLDNFTPPTSWSSSGSVMGTLSFDGVDDYISVTDPGTGSVLDYDSGDQITLTAWIKSDNLTGYRNIITKRSPVNYNFQTLGTGVMFGYESGGWHDFHAGVGTLNEGQWHHIAATHTNNGNPNSISIYIDGQPVAGGSWVEGDGTATSSPSNGPLLFGTESGGTVNQFDGLMDDLRIYNRVLSATEINALYKIGIGNCTNPVGKEGDIIMGDIDSGAGTDNALMYCDGSNWQAVGKIP